MQSRKIFKTTLNEIIKSLDSNSFYNLKYEFETDENQTAKKSSLPTAKSFNSLLKLKDSYTCPDDIICKLIDILRENSKFTNNFYSERESSSSFIGQVDSDYIEKLEYTFQIFRAKFAEIFDEIGSIEKNSNDESNDGLLQSRISPYIPAYLTILNKIITYYTSINQLQTALSFTNFLDNCKYFSTFPNLTEKISYPKNKLLIKSYYLKGLIFEILKQPHNAKKINLTLAIEFNLAESFLFSISLSSNNVNYINNKHEVSVFFKSCKNLIEEKEKNEIFPIEVSTFYKFFISMQEKNYDVAIKNLEKLRKMKSLAQPAIGSKIYALTAECYFLNNNKQKSLEYFQQMIKFYPTFTENLDLYALILYEVSNFDLLDKLILYLSAHQLTNCPQYWICLGFIATVKERHKHAIFCSGKATAFTSCYDDQNVQAFILKGINLENLGRVDDAIKNFREVIRLQPYRQDGYACVIHCLIQSKNAAEALQVASEAIKYLSWKNVEAVSLYAIALYENVNNDEKMIENCITVVKRALSLCVNHENIIKVLATLYLKTGQYQEVVDLLKTHVNFIEIKDPNMIKIFSHAEMKIRDKRQNLNRRFVTNDKDEKEEKRRANKPTVNTAPTANIFATPLPAVSKTIPIGVQSNSGSSEYLSINYETTPSVQRDSDIGGVQTRLQRRRNMNEEQGQDGSDFHTPVIRNDL